MKATIIIKHDTDAVRKIKPEHIILTTKAGKQKKLTWDKASEIYRNGYTHIVTGRIRIKDPESDKPVRGASMNWVKKNIQHAHAETFLSENEPETVSKLKSCILCEMQPDKYRLNYGIPINHT